jgi:hypothetical protein
MPSNTYLMARRGKMNRGQVGTKACSLMTWSKDETSTPAVCELHRCRASFLLGMLMLLPMVLSAKSAVAQDILVYPAKGQSQTQQDKDRYECHTWAVKRDRV